jgi:hypothetical protein
MLGYNALKPKDLSHLVDSRIGNPDADLNNRVSNAGRYTDSDWVDSNSDGLADGWFDENLGVDTDTSIVTGNGFSGNAQRFEYVGTGVLATRVLSQPLSKTYKAGQTIFVRLKYRSNTGLRVYLYDPSSSISGYLSRPGANTGDAQEIYGIVTLQDDKSEIWLYLGDDNDHVTGDYMEVDDIWIHEWNGEELIPDPDVGFVANDVSNWSANGTNGIEQDGNAVKITYVDSEFGAYERLRQSTDVNMFSDPVAGDKFNVAIRTKVNSGSSVILETYDGVAYTDQQTITNTDYEVKTFRTTMQGTNLTIRAEGMGAGEIIWIEIISVMKVKGLVAAYNMIPNGDTLVDISGGGNNGTIPVGNISSIYNGLYNSGQDGLAGKIDLASDIDDIYDFTICLRFILGDTPSEYMITTDGSGRFIRITNATTIRFYNGLVTDFTVDSLIVGKEYSLTLARTGSVFALYLNGILQDVDTGDENVFSIASLMGLVSSQVFGGTWMDFKLYNYAFSEQEAKNYHNQFAKQIEQRHSFDDLGVGSTI